MSTTELLLRHAGAGRAPVHQQESKSRGLVWQRTAACVGPEVSPLWMPNLVGHQAEYGYINKNYLTYILDGLSRSIFGNRISRTEWCIASEGSVLRNTLRISARPNSVGLAMRCHLAGSSTHRYKDHWQGTIQQSGLDMVLHQNTPWVGETYVKIGSCNSRIL